MKKKIYVLCFLVIMGILVTGVNAEKTKKGEPGDWEILYKKVVRSNATMLYHIMYLHEKLPKKLQKELNQQITHSKKLLNTWKVQYKITFKKEQISARAIQLQEMTSSAHEIALACLKIKIECMKRNIALLRQSRCKAKLDEQERKITLRFYIREQESLKDIVVFIHHAIKYKK